MKDFNPDNVYDTLSFIFDNKDRIIRRMNTNLVKKAHRSPEIIFYDVTNFYFETEQPDDDTFDEEGNLLSKGFVDTDDPDLKRIMDAFGIEIPTKLFRRAELKQIKTRTEVFM